MVLLKVILTGYGYALGEVYEVDEVDEALYDQIVDGIFAVYEPEPEEPPKRSKAKAKDGEL